MNNLTDEQIDIINKIDEYNIKIDAVAGSGKTSTCLEMGKHYKDKNILVLTYNSIMKNENRNKVKLRNIENIENHSFHSFCHKYYRSCYKEKPLELTIKEDTIPKENYNYDIIVIDEAQDLTNTYKNFILKVFKDNKSLNPSYCIIGDIRQCIYEELKNADIEIMNNCDKYFINKKKWINLNLSKSFRLTNNITNFVNKVLLEEDKIVPNGIEGDKPEYYYLNSFNNAKIVDLIIDLKKKNYKNGDFLILAPSLKESTGKFLTPVKRLENLIKTNIKYSKVYFPTSDLYITDESIIKNKIVFSTFHQSKGMERKIVIIYNFDTSYYFFDNNLLNYEKCPNLFYVICTRASEKLYLLHGNGNCGFENDNIKCNHNGIIPFIKNSKNNLLDYVDIKNVDIGLPQFDYIYNCPGKSFKIYKYKSESVSSLIKPLTNLKIIENILKFCKTKYEILKDTDEITYKSILDNKDTKEDISALMGSTIVEYYLYKNYKNFKLGITDIHFISHINVKQNIEISKIIDNLNFSNLSFNDYLFIIKNRKSSLDSIINPLNQIDTTKIKFGNNKLNLCKNNIKLLIGDINKSNVINELYVKKIVYYNNNIINVIGYIDLIVNNDLYEFKFSKNTIKESDDYIIQTLLYSYLYFEKIYIDKYLGINDTIYISKYGKNINKSKNYVIDDIFRNVKKIFLKKEKTFNINDCKIIDFKIITRDISECNKGDKFIIKHEDIFYDGELEEVDENKYTVILKEYFYGSNKTSRYLLRGDITQSKVFKKIDVNILDCNENKNDNKIIYFTTNNKTYKGVINENTIKSISKMYNIDDIYILNIINFDKTNFKLFNDFFNNNKIILFNIIKGEKITIKTDIKKLTKMFELIIKEGVGKLKSFKQ